MRNILPIEYKYRFNSIVVGIIFLSFSIKPLIMKIILNVNLGNMDSTTKIIFICFGLFGIFTLCKNITVNLKVVRLRKWRRNMLSKKFVRGNIEEIEEVIVRGINNKSGVLRYTDDVGIYYSMVVSYLDPITGYKKIVKSDPYDEMLKYCLASNEVNVYINENNEILIDDLKIRKLRRDERIKLNNEEEDNQLNNYVGYIIGKYENIISIVSIIIFILVMGFWILK